MAGGEGGEIRSAGVMLAGVGKLRHNRPPTVGKGEGCLGLGT